MKENQMKALNSIATFASLVAFSAATAFADMPSQSAAVLYIHPQSESNRMVHAYSTPNYAFADKIGNSLSIAIWVKDRIGPGDREKFIAGVPGRWWLSIPNGCYKNLSFATQSGKAEADGHVVDDQRWHFLVGTFNYDAKNPENSFQRLYVDGVLAAQLMEGVLPISAPENAFSLGAAAYGMHSGNNKGVPAGSTFVSGEGASGYFSNLSVWNRALTAGEVKDLYGWKPQRLVGNESGLVAYWPLAGTPGAADVGSYRFANAAATTGVPPLSTYWLCYGRKCGVDFVEDAVVPVNMLADAGGAIVGWMRPSNDFNDIVKVDDAQGKRVASLRLFFADIAQMLVKTDDGKTLDLHRVANDLRYRTDEWLHVAFVWRNDGTSRFYVNGKSWGLSALSGDAVASLKGTHLGAAAKFHCRSATARDFRIEKRPLAAAEVLDEYYAACPVDIAIDDGFLDAGAEASATWTLAPAGVLTRPHVTEGFVPRPAKVEIATEVRRLLPPDAKAKCFFGEEVLVSTPFAEYDVAAPIAMKTTSRAYEPGRYRLSVRIRRPGQTNEFLRNIFFRAVEPVKLAAPSEDSLPWRKTETFFSKAYACAEDAKWTSGPAHAATDAAGTYLEAGESVGDRFADIVTIPKDAIGKPCLLEIEWPDDKPRQMGLYMYEITSASCRDHLQGGLVAGEEIPNSGTRQIRSYLYYPSNTNALFEARTFVKSRPAAVAKLTLSRLAEPFPVLKIRKPKSLPCRRFGHTDEDQTFDNNLSKSIMGGDVVEILRNFVSYFGYTGQNWFAYPTLRYRHDFTPIDGETKLIGLWPREQGLWKGVIRTLAANGIEFVSEPTLGNVPSFAFCDRTDNTFEERGLILKGKDGKNVTGLAKGVARPDLSKDEALRIVINELVPGLRYTMEAGADTLVLDLNADLFSPFTFLDGKSGPSDFGERSKIVTRAFRTLVGRLRQIKPDLKIVCLLPVDETDCVKRGVNPAEIAAVGGLSFGVMRGNTKYYFRRFYGKTEAELDILDNLYDPEAKALRSVAALCPGGALTYDWSYPSYFETFTKPIGDDKRFQNYFQNADIKPHGRWFLKEPAYLLAKCDVQNFAVGSQPLGSLGNEDETREFTQAYCALPARPFAAVPGVDDPIVARYLETDEGVFLYVVNYSHVSVEAKFSGVPSAKSVTDLSAGARADLDSVALKPFQLRSFLMENGEVRPAAIRLALGAYDRHAFDSRIKETEAAAVRMKAGGIDVEDAMASLGKAKAALEKGRLAEAHYWFFHRTVNGMMERCAQYDNVVAESAMNAKGRYAVNCGCGAFTVLGGKLFSPDKPWDGKTYGYFGDSAKSCNRDKALCDAACPLRELFATELYDIEGYRFKVPKGRYRVTVHVKWSYPHSYKEAGKLVNAYSVNGTDMGRPIDFFAASNGEIKKPFALSATVDAENTVEVKVRGVGSVGDSSRLLNAIEIERIN